ncbi:hypothetical protein BGZ65_012330, partial [Modicella reniformis]
MNSSKASSRNQQLSDGATAAATPRRVKVVNSAQIDISSMMPPSKPSSLPGSGTVTPTNSARASINNIVNSGIGSSVGYTPNGNNNSTPAQRLTTATRTQSSNPTALLKSTNGASGGDGGHIKSKDGGSVTSDDGTVSEDSDRAGDDVQLFSGGQTNINGGFNLSFSGRQGFPVSLFGPKIAIGESMNRHRPSSSVVGLSTGNKPIRIAAAMKNNFIPTSKSSLGLSTAGSASGASTPPFTSSSGATTRSVRNGSAATAVASANKQAEDNRRAEEAARTRRKLADLEIANSSLLSINKALEATVRKQANEVQELKMRIQSAHFGELAADVALEQSVEAIELTETEMHDDLTFKRLCMSIEQMVHEAKQALNQSTKPTGVKVLSLHELYEKEVVEEKEREDDDEADQSFIGDESIEMIHQEVDNDNNNTSLAAESLLNSDINAKPIGRGNRKKLSTPLSNNIMGPAILDAPLTM